MIFRLLIQKVWKKWTMIGKIKERGYKINVIDSASECIRGYELDNYNYNSNYDYNYHRKSTLRVPSLLACESTNTS